MSLRSSPLVASRRTAVPQRRAIRVTGRRRSSSGAGFDALRLLPDIVLGLLVFFLSLNINLGAVETQGFHPDETRWLNRSHYIKDILDPFGPAWQDYYLTRGQPPLGSYMMGIGQLVQGKTLYPNNVWDFYFDAKDPVTFSDNPEIHWNEVSGAMPSLDNLYAGRRTSAFVGALAVVTVYLLGRLLTNRVGGMVAALVLAIHPLNRLIASQALSDQLLIMLLGLSCIVAWRLARRPTWATAVVLGVLLGLGGAVKLTPMLLGIPLAMMGAFYLLRAGSWRDTAASRARDRRLGWRLLVQPVVAFATFVLVYPYLWVDPIGRTYNLFRFRVDEMAIQGQLFDHAHVADVSVGLGRTGNRLAVKHQAGTEVLTWINDRLGTALAIAGIDLLLAIAGGLLLALFVVRSGLRSPHALVVALLVAETATIIYGLRSDLYRYFLPLVWVEVLCIGTLAGVVWSILGGAPLRRLVERTPLESYLLGRDAGRVTAAAPASAPRHEPVPLPPRVRALRPRPTFTSSHAD